MKPQDIFADHLHIGWPVVAPRLVVRVAKHREVVAERVDPDVDDLFGIIGHWHTPAEALFGTADRDIFDAVFDELK